MRTRIQRSRHTSIETKQFRQGNQGGYAPKKKEVLELKRMLLRAMKTNSTAAKREREEFRRIVSRIPNTASRKYWIAACRDWDTFRWNHSMLFTERKRFTDEGEYEKFIFNRLAWEYRVSLTKKKILNTLKYLPDNLRTRLRVLRPKDYRSKYIGFVETALRDILKDVVYHPDGSRFYEHQKEIGEVLTDAEKRKEIIDKYVAPAIEEEENNNLRREWRRRFWSLLSKDTKAFMYFIEREDEPIFPPEEVKLMLELEGKSHIAFTKYVWKRLSTVKENRFESVIRDGGLVDSSGRLLYPVELRESESVEQEPGSFGLSRGELKKIICDYAIRDGCKTGETVPSTKIRKWISEIESGYGKKVKEGAIRVLLSRLSYSRERPF